MYKIEDVTKVMDMEGHETDDGYNAIRTTLLGIVTEGLNDYNTVTAERDNLKSENDRLKNANAMLYGQIEKQYTSKFSVDGQKNDDKENDEDDISQEEKAEKKLQEQIKLYSDLS